MVIDATGAPSVLQTRLDLLGIGGTLFVYGMTPENASLTINPYDVFRRELTHQGLVLPGVQLRSGHDPAAHRPGQQSTGIISHRFGLADYGHAIEAVAHDSSCIKAVIAP